MPPTTLKYAGYVYERGDPLGHTQRRGEEVEVVPLADHRGAVDALCRIGYPDTAAEFDATAACIARTALRLMGIEPPATGGR
jgi:hypothetical protein